MTASDPTPIDRARSGKVERIDDARADRDYTQPPNSVQSEEAVLGSILKNPSAIAHIATDLKPADFYDRRHGQIFAAMAALFERSEPIDYHSTAAETKRQGTYESSGGLLYLSEINLATPSAAHIKHYASIVRRTAHARGIIGAAQQVAEVAYRDDLTEDELAQRAQAIIASASARSAGRRLIYPEDWVVRYQDRLESVNESGTMGISTGLIDLDSITLGLQPGNLMLLCARPGVGKTELAGQIALDVARGHSVSGGRCHAGKGWVLFVSIEMTEEELAERAASALSGVDKVRLLTGRMNDTELNRLSDGLNVLNESRLALAVESGITSSDVRALALQLEAAKGQIDLVVVDYVQLLQDKKSESSNRNDDIGFAAQQLKRLAGDLGCAVLAPTQLSRAVDARADKRPLLSDVRDSGELEQAGDIVLAMYRDEMYNGDSDKKGITEIINRKHRRFGQLRGASAQLLYARTRYVDLEVFRS